MCEDNKPNYCFALYVYWCMDQNCCYINNYVLLKDLLNTNYL